MILIAQFVKLTAFSIEANSNQHNFDHQVEISLIPLLILMCDTIFIFFQHHSLSLNFVLTEGRTLFKNPLLFLT